MTTNSTDGLFNNLLKPKENQDPNIDTSGEAAENSDPASELNMLKNRARLMGISFSNNIGIESLKARIQARLEGEAKEEEAKEEPEIQEEPVNSAPAVQASAAVTRKSKRQKMYAEQMKLVRVRITNLNPSKKDLPGEIFTFANKVLGAVRKFVPYGEVTEKGYHIPYCIYTQLKEREFVNIKTRKDSHGRTIVESSMSREFALEVLPSLTKAELASLAAQQAAADGMSS